MTDPPATSNSFGYSVSVDGNLLAAGAWSENQNQGALYIFEKTGSGWSQTARLAPAGVTSIGFSVAVSGGTIAVSVYEVNYSRSAIYLFEKVNGSWIQVQTLTGDSSNGTVVVNNFGTSLAMQNGVVVVGASEELTVTDGVGRRGAAYVFEKTGTTWSRTQKLTASDGKSEGSFGGSVDVSGQVVVVGNALDNYRSGAAYVFEKQGSMWQQTKKLIAGDADRDDVFGTSVSITANTVAVGAPSKNRGQGAVYVFEKNGTSWPDSYRRLTASDADNFSYFGRNIALEKECLVVGAYSRGAAYVYQKSGNGWEQRQKLTADGMPANVTYPLDGLGIDVALSGDAIAVGAFNANAANKGGGVFVYKPSSSPPPPPPPVSGCGLTKVRLLPRQSCCYGRTIGGQIQVSTVGKNGPWQTVVVFSDETAKVWSEATPTNLNGPYKAIRYLAPNDGYGNVAELEFYNGDQKLTGTAFADAGGPWNGLQDRTFEKAFDGNPSTFYDANNANGAFVGLELSGCNTPPPPPLPTASCVLTEVRLVRRQDCCNGRTVGGQIQISAEGKNGPWQTVYTITDESGPTSVLTIANAANTTKAVRYLAPNDGYGNVAELEFYNDNQKLTGTAFADAGGPWNGLQDRTFEKAFDGNPNTFYDANNASGAFVGLELNNCNPGINRLAAPETESFEPSWALQVAPNPSAGQVKAQVQMPQAGRITLTLTNVLGQVISRQDVDGWTGPNAVEVDFSRQPVGLYLLRAQTAGQKPLVQKLLKQND